MAIKIYNDTDTALEWIGSSTYSPLDGLTMIQHFDQRIEPGTVGKVDISKEGGTDGLFTLVSYDFPYRSTSLNIYAIMPASAGGKATVKLVDHSARNQPQLKDNGPEGAATMWYSSNYRDDMKDGPWTSNAVETKWGIMGKEWAYEPGRDDQEVWRITRTLTKEYMLYPNSQCSVRVTSESTGRRNWNIGQD
ncbi:hypothetical protein EK21DRAFT_112535 [Setomelanomma holmii]|uniref:Uncharacterized protein n=1 Tax=Setomelanomma holmii TaxID=210430 RepID=A0A9P4H8S8_9PLEO|nr:hypothetical protein EK21DRAFT_112535 [Setomelanomma holmii]